MTKPLTITAEEAMDAVAALALEEWLRSDEFTVYDYARRHGMSRAAAAGVLERQVEAGRLSARIARREDGKLVRAYRLEAT